MQNKIRILSITYIDYIYIAYLLQHNLQIIFKLLFQKKKEYTCIPL